ncbi:unnamed protein product [Linum tenue]|nr:unnamed protein product [Linum tenue]
MGGPWMLGETYLTVHRWFKGFNPWKTEVTSTMVWAQLPELPIEFINKEAAMKIGGYLGKAVRVDRATELGARGKYARVCVEVDLTQPLTSQFRIEGVKYLVQYEGLEDLCTNCGTYGKSTGRCQCVPRETEMETEDSPVENPVEKEDPTQGKVYGEWMKVKPRGRGPTRTENGRKMEEKTNINRFQGLAEEVQEVETVAINNNEEEGTVGKVIREQEHANLEGIINNDLMNTVAPVGPPNTMHDGQQSPKLTVKEASSSQTQMHEKQPHITDPRKSPTGQAMKGKGSLNREKGEEGKKKEQKKGGGPQSKSHKEPGGNVSQKTADGAGNRSPLGNK